MTNRERERLDYFVLWLHETVLISTSLATFHDDCLQVMLPFAGLLELLALRDNVPIELSYSLGFLDDETTRPNHD